MPAQPRSCVQRGLSPAPQRRPMAKNRHCGRIQRTDSPADTANWLPLGPGELAGVWAWRTGWHPGMTDRPASWHASRPASRHGEQIGIQRSVRRQSAPLEAEPHSSERRASRCRAPEHAAGKQGPYSPPENPSSSMRLSPSAAAVARASQRSFSGWPAWPFTHTNVI